jgi:hypothetical protein
MNVRPNLLLGVALCVLAASVTALAQTDNPIIGTWELNAGKSTYGAGNPPKKDIRTFSADGDGYKYLSTGTAADGTPFVRTYTAHYDGKDYPTTGQPDAESIAIKRIDRFTTETVQKRGGKVVITSTRVVSKDGKSFTLTSKGVNAMGKEFTNVLVFDRK